MMKLLHTARKEQVAKRLGITLTDEINEALRAAYNGDVVSICRLDLATQDDISLMLAGCCDSGETVVYYTTSNARATDLCERLNGAGFPAKVFTDNEHITEVDGLCAAFALMDIDILPHLHDKYIRLIIDEYSASSVDTYLLYSKTYEKLFSKIERYMERHHVQITHFRSNEMVSCYDEVFFGDYQLDLYSEPYDDPENIIAIQGKHTRPLSSIDLYEIEMTWDLVSYPYDPDTRMYDAVRSEIGDNGQVMVYVPTPEAAEKMYRSLGLRPFVARMHEDMDTELRNASLSRFSKGKIDALIATPAFGPNAEQGPIKKIVIAGLPLGINEFCQIIDRANSDSCEVILYYTDADFGRNVNYIRNLPEYRDAMLVGLLKLNSSFSDIRKHCKYVKIKEDGVVMMLRPAQSNSSKR